MRCPPESMFEKVGRLGAEWELRTQCFCRFERSHPEEEKGEERQTWRMAKWYERMKVGSWGRERGIQKEREWKRGIEVDRELDSISSFSHISCNSFRIPKSGLEHDKTFFFSAKRRVTWRKSLKAFEKLIAVTLFGEGLSLKSFSRKSPHVSALAQSKNAGRGLKEHRESLSMAAAQTGANSTEIRVSEVTPGPQLSRKKIGSRVTAQIASNKGIAVWTRDNLQKFLLFRCVLPRSVFASISDFKSIISPFLVVEDPRRNSPLSDIESFCLNLWKSWNFVSKLKNASLCNFLCASKKLSRRTAGQEFSLFP